MMANEHLLHLGVENVSKLLVRVTLLNSLPVALDDVGYTLHTHEQSKKDNSINIMHCYGACTRASIKDRTVCRQDVAGYVLLANLIHNKDFVLANQLPTLLKPSS